MPKIKRVKLYTLYKSKTKYKKFDVYVINPRTKNVKKVSFGDNRYEDYTIHKDKWRRKKYITRHKHDKIYDVTKPGFWSMWVLWGKYTSITKCLAYTKKRFKLK